MKKKKLKETIDWLRVGLSLYPICVESSKPRLYEALQSAVAEDKNIRKEGISVIKEYHDAICAGDYT